MVIGYYLFFKNSSLAYGENVTGPIMLVGLKFEWDCRIHATRSVEDNAEALLAGVSCGDICKESPRSFSDK